jgi:hypothetical protein
MAQFNKTASFKELSDFVPVKTMSIVELTKRET